MLWGVCHEFSAEAVSFAMDLETGEEASLPPLLLLLSLPPGSAAFPPVAAVGRNLAGDEGTEEEEEEEEPAVESRVRETCISATSTPILDRFE